MIFCRQEALPHLVTVILLCVAIAHYCGIHGGRDISNLALRLVKVVVVQVIHGGHSQCCRAGPRSRRGRRFGPHSGFCRCPQTETVVLLSLQELTGQTRLRSAKFVPWPGPISLEGKEACFIF